jgi:hypothetical protein
VEGKQAEACLLQEGLRHYGGCCFGVGTSIGSGVTAAIFVGAQAEACAPGLSAAEKEEGEGQASGQEG